MSGLLPDPYREEVRAVLREDVPAIVLGILFLALSLAAVALSRLRRRTRDPALLWLGCFSGLYAIRLLILAETVQFVMGLPRPVWAYAAAAITYLIPLPGLLFAWELFPVWRGIQRWMIRLQAIFAGAGILLDQVLRRPESLGLVNNVLVLAAIGALVTALFRQRERTTRTSAILAGVLTFAASAVINNLASLRSLPLKFNAEPLGFAVFLGSLGYAAALRTIDNEERLTALDKELEIARKIQVSILPRQMPCLRGLTIEACYVPMAAVAGDFYDFLVLDDRRVGILVADVSGHGVPAALIASMVKVAIAGQVHHADDPAKVLSGMNQVVCAGKLKGQFVTAAYLYIDVEARVLRYASAGHPPLLWWHKTGETVDAVVQNGIALGFRAGAAYNSVERAIAPGDRFLVYTDGLFEAMNEGKEQFGEERVREVFAAGQGLASMLESRARWAGYDRGRPADDDLTVLWVELSDLRCADASSEPERKGV